MPGMEITVRADVSVATIDSIRAHHGSPRCPKTTTATQYAAMTATSRGRTAGQQKARDVRGLGMPIVRGPTASDRERRSAAAAARGVRVLESEPRLLEVALVVQRGAVQILSAEAVHEAAHTCALDDDVVLARLVFDIEAIAEPRAPAGEHRDAEPRRLG